MGKERWYVGFVDADLPWWLRWMTRPKFRHIVMMRYDVDYKIWLFVEWSSRRLYVEVYKKDEVSCIWEDIRARGSMLSIETKEIFGNMSPKMPIYCVTWAKQLIGLNEPFILTPYQLSCELKRLGADVIFE